MRRGSDQSGLAAFHNGTASNKFSPEVQMDFKDRYPGKLPDISEDFPQP